MCSQATIFSFDKKAAATTVEQNFPRKKSFATPTQFFSLLDEMRCGLLLQNRAIATYLMQ